MIFTQQAFMLSIRPPPPSLSLSPRYTCRTLFEHHKLLFSFQMCAKILETSGKLNMDEYNFFLRGGVVSWTEGTPEYGVVKAGKRGKTQEGRGRQSQRIRPKAPVSKLRRTSRSRCKTGSLGLKGDLPHVPSSHYRSLLL